MSDHRTTRHPAVDDRFPVPLRGVDVGPETRCTHYDGPRDIIAIRFACCDAFYPCHKCHRATTDHDAQSLPSEQRETAAVLCGRCGATLSPNTYLESEYECPGCGALFNPGCAAHHDHYFSFV